MLYPARALRVHRCLDEGGHTPRLKRLTGETQEGEEDFQRHLKAR
jgi:hypothetical protein